MPSNTGRLLAAIICTVCLAPVLAQDCEQLAQNADRLGREWAIKCGPGSPRSDNEFDREEEERQCAKDLRKWLDKEHEYAECLEGSGVAVGARRLMDAYRRYCGGSGGSGNKGCQTLLRRLQIALKELKDRYRSLGCDEHPNTEDCRMLRNLIEELERLLGEKEVKSSPPISTTPQDLAGIDFTSIKLAYVEGGGQSGKLPLVFSAATGRGQADGKSGSQAYDLARMAFRAGVLLPASTFWVNLNPSEPSRIADQQLGKTDVARVMLEADLRMKRDSAAITDPRSSANAREYWRRLDDAAGATGPRNEIRQESRFWIVPGDIELFATNDEAYLRAADLKVQLESEYLGKRGQSGAVIEAPQSAKEKAQDAAQELVLPTLQTWVNAAPQYHELRQVFASLVLATWYKQRYGENTGARQLETLPTLFTRPGWTPKATWEEYRRSVEKGEYNFTEERSEKHGNVTSTHISQYFSGGVDFTEISLPPESPIDPTVGQALRRAANTSEPVKWKDMVLFSDFSPLGVVPKSVEAGQIAESRSIWNGSLGVIISGVVVLACALLLLAIARRHRE